MTTSNVTVTAPTLILSERPVESARFPLDDMNDIVVTRARSQAERQAAFNIRWKGYSKYFPSVELCNDSYDDQENCVLLLATSRSGTPLGTLRILTWPNGPIELHQFVQAADILPRDLQTLGEATRFSIPHGPLASATKLALWKAYLTFCLNNGIDAMIGWVRKPATRDLRMLCFKPAAQGGTFCHPRLNGAEHYTYFLDLRTAEAEYADLGHPLHQFFFHQYLPNLDPDR